jgi:hypothetical protein
MLSLRYAHQTLCKSHLRASYPLQETYQRFTGGSIFSFAFFAKTVQALTLIRRMRFARGRGIQQGVGQASLKTEGGEGAPLQHAQSTSVPSTLLS